MLPGWLARALVMLCAASACACSHRAASDPRTAADSYARAAASGDADALYAMLDESSRRELSRDEVRRLVADERQELADQARALADPSAKVHTSARLRFRDGEEVLLIEHDGQFGIASADALPAGAQSPVQALDELRRVLARRSYAGLLRVLSASTRSAIESDLRALVDGLEHPEALDVQQNGDQATVVLAGGHRIRLRREEGTWRVDDID